MMGRLGKRVRVIKAAPQQELKMRLTFEDGVSKVVDLEPMMQGPIFESLRENPALFRDVKIEGGTIAWANGADIDPDVLYYGLKPAWMEVPESA